jgi:hypothetical protein
MCNASSRLKLLAFFSSSLSTSHTAELLEMLLELIDGATEFNFVRLRRDGRSGVVPLAVTG